MFQIKEMKRNTRNCMMGNLHWFDQQDTSALSISMIDFGEIELKISDIHS